MKNLKRSVAVLLTLLFALAALSACGQPASQPAGEGATTDKTETKAPEDTGESGTADPAGPAAIAPPAEAALDGGVLLEKDGITVRTAGPGTDPTSADDVPVVWVIVDNASAKDVFVGLTAGAVDKVASQISFCRYKNGEGVELFDFENGGADIRETIQSSSFDVPANEARKFALGWSDTEMPDSDPAKAGEVVFALTLSAEESAEPYFVSDRVLLKVGDPVEEPDIASLGTVAIDNDKILVVFGDEDHNEWFGPEVPVYVKNKTEGFICLTAEQAEADGMKCDYPSYSTSAVAPGNYDAGMLRFFGEIAESKGFEKLTVDLRLFESGTLTGVFENDPVDAGKVEITFPKQEWGVYENGGLTLEIKPKIHSLLKVETPQNDPNGVLFTVAEKASYEVSKADGAGELFAILRVDAEKLHSLLCGDMSGMRVFASGGEGDYYIVRTPTDVRFERPSPEQMQADFPKWAALVEWAEGMPEALRSANGLEYASFDDSPVARMYYRAAWEKGVSPVLNGEYGEIAADAGVSALYLDHMINGYLWSMEDVEAPEGEALLTFSIAGEDETVSFFPDDAVVYTAGGNKRVYEAVDYENLGYENVALGWYYALAEKEGKKPADTRLDPFTGSWNEKIAGRAAVSISRSLAPGKAVVTASWPDSAKVMNTWQMIAFLGDDGKLTYENGQKTVTEFDENGEEASVDESYDESGYFYLNDAKELVWHSDNLERDDDGVFILASAGSGVAALPGGSTVIPLT